MNVSPAPIELITVSKIKAKRRQGCLLNDLEVCCGIGRAVDEVVGLDVQSEGAVLAPCAEEEGSCMC